MIADVCRITQRDTKMIQFLISQGQATAEQLAERFFPSMGAFYKRTHFLIKMGLIEADSIEKCAKATPSGVSGFMTSMRVSRDRVKKMKVYRIAKRIRRKLPFANGEHCEDRLLKHQLLLSNVRERIEKYLESRQYVILNDAELQGEHRTKMYGQSIVPDLVFRGPGLELAVELERSKKRESELLLRFAQYRDSRYEKVIYFCESENTRRSVTRVANLYRKIAVGSIWDDDRVFYDREFYLLSDFIQTSIV